MFQSKFYDFFVCLIGTTHCFIFRFFFSENENDNGLRVDPERITDGQTYIGGNIMDYKIYGLELAEYSVLQFLVGTYKEAIPKGEDRKPDKRVSYVGDHLHAASHWRVICHTNY